MTDSNMGNFHENFNASENRCIFCMWTGDNPMSTDRIQALWSIFNNTGCPVIFINKHNLSEWIHPNYPLHPAFEFLSSTHKSDYLRCYFMHHYGGGYTDIKQTTRKWGVLFDKLNGSSSLALGYQELAHGIPHLENTLGDEIRKNHKHVIGLCSFIFKKNSDITSEWLSETNKLLDSKLAELIKFPAQHPQDQYSVILPDNTVSRYPLRWAELLGEIFHPIIYKHNESLIQGEIAPLFSNYR